jgi:hypothetical protein
VIKDKKAKKQLLKINESYLYQERLTLDMDHTAIEEVEIKW